MQKIENGQFIVNNADSDQHYSQRNNQFVQKNSKGMVEVNAASMCNVTSLVMTADINGWKFPSGKYSQPEDNLMDFISKSKEVDKYYKKTMPVMYNDWKKCKLTPSGKIDYYTPNEVHAVLAYGFNLWVGCSTADTFRENVTIPEIVNELLEGRAVTISGLFSGLHHIVSLVGAKWDLSRQYTATNNTVPKILQGIKAQHIAPATFIINDPYGDYHNYSAGKSGRGIELTYNQFIEMVKPLNNYNIKMAHFVKSGAATI